ncbi:uncharacterized protein LOC143039129 [Oratosquilla oratoria]|uniref:uncharacterized protein LOC143039129 n=1 Tax=Oratosquilla oratoria TaxID=337810 RepID=UPI003F757611
MYLNGASLRFSSDKKTDNRQNKMHQVHYRAEGGQFLQVVFFATIVVLSLAAPKPDSPPAYEYPAPPPPVYKEPGMPFEFAYAVKDDYSGNNFSHDEKSDGDVTSGSYRVLLPDGRTQIVTFTADHHNGYVAEVTYEGEATYPAPAPYHPPPPPAPYHPPPPAPLYKPAPASAP